MLLNCGVGEDSWESLGLHRSNQSILKEISPGYLLEGQIWSWSSNTLANCCKELTHLKRPWCWERLKVAGERDNRGWDGWMESPTQWIWVWANSGSWWWTEKPGVLQSMGSQKVGHDWETELNWAEPRVSVALLSHRKMIVVITHPCIFPLEAQSSNMYVLLTHSVVS